MFTFEIILRVKKSLHKTKAEDNFCQLPDIIASGKNVLNLCWCFSHLTLSFVVRIEEIQGCLCDNICFYFQTYLVQEANPIVSVSRKHSSK